MNTTQLMVQPTVNPFAFNGFEVRTITDGNQVWFCAKDVFDAIGCTWAGTKGSLSNTPEKWVMVWNLQTIKGEKNLIFISEPAVYQTLFRSKMPEAVKFTEWVCEEVLPAIRKTGFYGKVDPKTRVIVSKQIMKLMEYLVGSRNKMQQEWLINEIRSLSNMIGQPMPNIIHIYENIDQPNLPL